MGELLAWVEVLLAMSGRSFALRKTCNPFAVVLMAAREYFVRFFAFGSPEVAGPAVFLVL